MSNPDIYCKDLEDGSVRQRIRSRDVHLYLRQPTLTWAEAAAEMRRRGWSGPSVMRFPDKMCRGYFRDLSPDQKTPG